jgi:hypothetical protein
MKHTKLLLLGMLALSIVCNCWMTLQVFSKADPFEGITEGNTQPDLQQHPGNQLTFDQSMAQDVIIPRDVNWTNLWQALYGLNDGALVAELQSRGIANVMIYPLVLGRIEAHRLEQEEAYLLDTPFWKDATEDLLHLYDQSEARTEALHRKLFGARWAGADAVERIRRDSGWQKWRLNMPPDLCSALGQYHMRKDRLEASEFDMLKDLLSEEEFQQYRIENSWESRYRASSLEWMHPAQEEFDAIMQYEFGIDEITKEKNSQKASRDPDFQEVLQEKRRQLDAQIETALGSDRFNDYTLCRLQAAPAVMAMQHVYGLDESQVREILQINWDEMARIRNGLSQFPDDSSHYRIVREQIKSMLSEEAYAALVKHTAPYFPRGFFKE